MVSIKFASNNMSLASNLDAFAPNLNLKLIKKTVLGLVRGPSRTVSECPVRLCRQKVGQSDSSRTFRTKSDISDKVGHFGQNSGKSDSNPLKLKMVKIYFRDFE